MLMVRYSPTRRMHTREGRRSGEGEVLLIQASKQAAAWPTTTWQRRPGLLLHLLRCRLALARLILLPALGCQAAEVGHHLVVAAKSGIHILALILLGGLLRLHLLLLRHLLRRLLLLNGMCRD